MMRGQYSHVGCIRSHSQQLSVRLLISSSLATSVCRSPESKRFLRRCCPKVFGCFETGKLRVQTGEALKEPWSLTYREARVQAFADAFLVIAICLAAAALLVPLLRKVAAPHTPSADAH